MKSLALLTALALLSACAKTPSSVDVVCSLALPTFTTQEIHALSDQTLHGMDLYFEQVRVACD